MWHSFVSSIDTIINLVVLGFVETAWRHPVIAGGGLLAFLLLTAMLWIEIYRDGTGGAAADEARPICPRR